MTAIQQGDITNINIYVPNIRVSKFIKQSMTDLREQIDSITIIIGDLNNPLAIMVKSSRQKINKETADLNYNIDQTNLKDIYKTFLPTAAEHTFFSSAHGTVSKIGHKTSLNKFKKTEIVPSIFSNHNVTKLEFNKRKWKKNTWKLNNTLLNLWVKEEVKKGN